jgi:hypothetical protein
VESNKIAGLSLQDCFDQQALLLTVLGEDGDNMTLAMDHGDFKPDNIIVDENYRIKGYRRLSVLTSLYRLTCGSRSVIGPTCSGHRSTAIPLASFATFQVEFGDAGGPPSLHLIHI